MTAQRRYSDSDIQGLTKDALRDGFCVLRNLFSKSILREWAKLYGPLLDEQMGLQGESLNRGPRRYYVTLPFIKPFAEPAIIENEDLLAIVEGLVGKDFVMCQLASDTPTLGSDYQDIHRDTRALFPETGKETPPFQLAVNFPLVDVGIENGPMEIARGTHLVSKEEGMEMIRTGQTRLEPVTMELGDVMIRDVRGLHRGTPNHTMVPRPMVVIGFSRRWLFRPEVNIHIPMSTWASLSERAKHMLRYNPRVESLDEIPQTETYSEFAY